MPDAPDDGEEDGPAADQIDEYEELPPHVPPRHPLLALLHNDVRHIVQHLPKDNKVSGLGPGSTLSEGFFSEQGSQ